MLETQICIWTLKLSYYSAAGHGTPQTVHTMNVRMANDVEQINEFWWFHMRQFKKLPSPDICTALASGVTGSNKLGKIGSTCASQQKLFLSAGAPSKGCFHSCSWYFGDLIASEGFASSGHLHLEEETIWKLMVGHHFSWPVSIIHHSHCKTFFLIGSLNISSLNLKPLCLLLPQQASLKWLSLCF